MVIAATGLFSFAAVLVSSLFCLLLATLFSHTKAAGILVFICVTGGAASRFMVVDSGINQLQRALPIESVELIGRVADIPAYYPYRSGNRGTWVFPIQCEGIKTTAFWQRCRGRIQVRVPGTLSEETCRRGERILFSGALRKRSYPGGEPIELAVPTSKDWNRLAGPPRFSPLIWIQRLRERGAQILSKGIEGHPDQLSVSKALMLGYRKAIPFEIIQQFRRTGTMHIFAISGLHVGMVGLLISILLKSVGIPRDKWGIWLLPLLLAYVCATGMSSSALRALTMAAVYFLAPLCRRKPDVPNAIAFSAILLLFLHPLEILSAGFIFSFTVVSFLVMGFSVVPSRFILKGSGWWGTVRAYVASLGITSVVAFIASIPLTALFFGTFSMVSLIGNLIVVPLTFCVVLTGWLSLLIPVASSIFNHASVVFINGLLGTVGFLSGLSIASFNIPPPPLLGVLVWYVGWIHLFTHARTAPQRIQSAFLILFAIFWTTLPQWL